MEQKPIGLPLKSISLTIGLVDSLGGGFNFFNFHPYLGKWSNLTNIFQMGWNHQPVVFPQPREAIGTEPTV